MTNFNTDRIAELLIKFRFEELTDLEKVELDIWIEQYQEEFKKLNSDEIFFELVKDYKSKQKVFARLQQKTVLTQQDCPSEKQQAPGFIFNIFKHRYRWRGVAAALILLCGSATFFINRPRSKNVKVAQLQQDILPGGNRATLTTGTGKSIVLDDQKNGFVNTEDGSSVEKTADGRIVYHAESSVASRNKEEIVYNTLSTPKGGQYFCQLPDGSKVWLNATSSLKYPVQFNGPTREVILSGEAYFEIIKPNSSESQPFVVKATKDNGKTFAEVRVLGTRFNINSYGDESRIATTLLDGKVKVFTGAESTNESNLNTCTIILKPGQQALIDATDLEPKRKPHIEVINEINTAGVVSWKEGHFHFENASVQQVMRQLSRWYSIEVIYQGNVSGHLITGDIQRNLTLSQVFEILGDLVHFEISGNKITVKP